MGTLCNLTTVSHHLRAWRWGAHALSTGYDHHGSRSAVSPPGIRRQVGNHLGGAVAQAVAPLARNLLTSKREMSFDEANLRQRTR
jgi:hypothetical protein